MDDFDILKNRMIDIIGFEDLMERLISKNSIMNYPPYNVEKHDKYTCIVIAVAGFTRGDIFIELCDNQLEIIGNKPAQDDGIQYIHKGIASRSFKKSFLLEKGMEIKTAQLKHGLLTIIIQRNNSTAKIRIPIHDADAADNIHRNSNKPKLN